VGERSFETKNSVNRERGKIEKRRETGGEKLCDFSLIQYMTRKGANKSLRRTRKGRPSDLKSHVRDQPRKVKTWKGQAKNSWLTSAESNERDRRPALLCARELEVRNA